MAIPVINVSILNGSNGFRLDGVANGDDSGRSVSNAGDVNGDGFDDVIVGASGANPNGLNSGSSYVVFGQASGFSAAMNLSSLDGSNGFRLDGGTEFRSLGVVVDNAGDVNGDGFNDVIIGARHVDSNGDISSTRYVIFGKASGFDATLNVSSLDGNNGFRLDGVAAYDQYDRSFNNAGDINGDGFDDLFVGDHYAGPNGRNSGASYVVFGKASGLGATLDLSSLDGSNGFRLNGVSADDDSGSSVSHAGDFNGDGFDDLIVGAPGAYPFTHGKYHYSEGASYVVFGKASGFEVTLNLSSLDGSNGFRLDGIDDFLGALVSNAGDVNGDGFDDLIVVASDRSYVVFGKAVGVGATLDLSSLDGSNGFRMDSRFFSSAGDVNGDGFDDLIAGASNSDSNGSLPGSSYVVFGKAAGFSAGLDITALDGSNGFRMDGVSRDDEFGFSVSGAGDVNGDGFDDLIVGADGASPNGYSSGSSYVIFGGDFINEAVYLGTPGEDNLVGTSAAERFEAGDGNDRMTGLGGADVFHGGAGNDTIVIGADFDFQSIDGGTGTDTLEFAGKLNLADFHDTISSIETIDLISSSDFNNTLTLTLSDLLSLSDTTDTFTVNGDAGDRVNGLKEGWEDGGIDSDYHIYTNQGTVLRVDTVVSTDRPKAGIINLADLDGENGLRLDGAGDAVSNAGDVNGDGFDDVIIDAYDRSYVVFGKAVGFGATLDLSSLDGSNGFRLDGAASNFFGSSVSNAGDVNGDGFDDLIVGADHTSPNGDFSGSSYVVFGKASGFDASLDLSSLDGSNGFSLDGVAAHDRSGFSVSSAGDVNGDGFDDVIVGAYYADSNGKNSGSSYVVFGKADGFIAAMNLSGLDGNNGFRLDGEAESDLAGESVSGAGDVNGDGFDDVIIGATGADDPNGDHPGSSYVVFGKTSAFTAAMNLSSLDGSNGFRLEGVAGDDFSGTSVSNAGDVNGDGFDDVIVSSPLAYQNGHGRVGSSYVVFGKASGFDATMDLSSLNGSNGFRLDGVADGDYSGRSVSGAGDVNGDGFDDLIVGAYRVYSNGYSGTGSSYVVFGKAAGFSTAMNLADLNGSNGFRLDGVKAYDHSGSSVSGAGDVNGDGFDDLIVGAPSADPNGSSYVIFGRSDFSGTVVTHPGTPGNDNLIGTQAADIFDAGDGDDNLIGRGGADVFHAGAGDDNIRVADLNFQLIDGGTGNDVLHLTGKDLNLDLSSLGDKISGIETICLYGNGDNALTVTAAGLMNLSDSTNTLKVNGNVGDHIVGLGSGWTDEGVRGNGYFHAYTQGDAVLLVGANVTTDFV